MDEIDRSIVETLQGNARISNAEIARQLGMAPSAILERIRKLEQRGIIRGYEARLNPRALQLGLLAFIYVKSEEKVGDVSVGHALKALPEVIEVHHIAGEDCYLIKVRVESTEALGELIRQRFGAIAGVKSTRTTIVMNTLKETACLPVRVKEESGE